MLLTNEGSLPVTMVFSGTKDAGSVLINFFIENDDCTHSGTYSVVQAKKVTITWITREPCMEAGNIIMDGKFTDEDEMSGTAEASWEPSTIIRWTATRR